MPEALLLLMMGSVAVRVAEVGELELELAVEIGSRLAQEIKDRNQSETKLEDPLWECDREDRCVAEIRSRTGMSEVVLLRIFGGPTKIQIEAERVSDLRSVRGSVRVPLEPDGWGPGIRELAASLFDAAPKLPEAPAPPPPPEPSGAFFVPWVLFGAGVVAGAVAVGLAVGSDAAADEIRGSILYGDRHRELASRQKTYGLVSDVLFGTAAASLIAGTATLFVF
jgi:hypothetical protein